nr:1-acyl-sn-glycerol-3-phosphate acyltransferase [Pseudomonadota bacterium]
SAGFSIPQVFLFTGLANAAVALYIFMVVPEYLLRFIALFVTRCIYRFHVRGDENIPVKGAAILVCNHVSFADAVLLMAASPRPIRFIMDHRIFRLPMLGAIFRLGKAIPVAPKEQASSTYEAAFTAARQVLDEGGLLCIFPEGRITRTGQLNEFKGGVMKVLQTHPVPVVPLALHNLWGSYLSRAKGSGGVLRRTLWRRVGLVAGEPMHPSTVTPERLRLRVQELFSSWGVRGSPRA